MEFQLLNSTGFGSLDRLPTAILIERRALTRCCLLKLFQDELTEVDFMALASTGELERVPRSQVKLTVISIEGKRPTEPSVLRDLAFVGALVPDSPVVLLADHHDEEMIRTALDLGVKGFVPISVSAEAAVAAMRLVFLGGVYCPRLDETPDERPLAEAQTIEGTAFSVRPAPRLQPPPDETADSARLEDDYHLTPREAEVLAELQRGCSNRTIARVLNLSENTVKMHVRHIMRKLRARNRTEVVLLSRSPNEDQLPGRGRWVRGLP